MRIVHRTPSGDQVVEIDVDDPTRSVGDLLAALGSPCDATQPGATQRVAATIDVVIDDCQVTADHPLSAVTMCEGSVIDVTASPPATPPARTLVVTGGVRAGMAVGADADVTIGRADDADLQIGDPCLSALHLSLRSGILRDHESRNGTSIEGHPVRGQAPLELGATVRAGATRLVLRRAVDDRPVAIAAALGAVGGTIPFNRPPRVDPMAEAPTLVVPGAPPEPPSPEALSMAGIILPIIAGGIIALLFSPFMAIFAALGPVLTVGTWWERRRRARRDYRIAMQEFTDDLAQLSLDLPARRVAEISRRRALHPDPGEVVRRASTPSVRCWERRPDHADAFIVGLGTDDETFRPQLTPSDGEVVALDAATLVAAQPNMADVPIPVDLSGGHVVGIVGDRAASVAVARSLVLQMATHHGPADLSIAVGADRRSEWAWCTWLPHTSDHASGRRGANVLNTSEVAAADVVIANAGPRTVLAVLDSDDPFQGRTTVGRRLLHGDHTAAIVLVGDAHRLPAGCDTVVTIDDIGRMQVVDPRQAGLGRPALGWGVSLDVATSASRRLARLDDPELPVVGAGVPANAALLALLSLSGDDPEEVEARWQRTDGTADLVVPIGADGEGPVMLDFVGDGPHLLVGGTTGSGKSELLRSIVAGVAATADPDHVAMVLVDYKGGAAFDCCADLPHVAGLVTDLDDELASRALRCLEAELRYREHRLREVGAEDLTAFRVVTLGRDDVEPLPRLVVVVDEFASLATDLPEFLDALVGIAQRGRSLGVHMILATQRPAGVVTDDIRANASCRIALRVTDRNDSVDVIDSPDAAAIPRSRPGRAVARFGPGELTPFQSALSTGHSAGRAGISIRGAVDAGEATTGPTDLQRLVESISAAHARRGGSRPRSPWPPQLPDEIVRGEPSALPIGAADWLLVDEPDEQRQSWAAWTPADGHLVVVGGPGAGSTTTLATAVLANTRGLGADAPHVHIIDLDAGRLGPLGALPAVGTMTGPTDGVRRGRLLRWLDEEITRRRGAPDDPWPQILLVVDDFAGLARAHDPVREAAVHDRFLRIWADGPAAGVVVATSIRRSADLPPSLIATVGTVLLHRTADQSDGMRFSMKVSTGGFTAGRAVRSIDGATVHVVVEAESIEEAVSMRSADVAPTPPPHEVGELRNTVPWADVSPTVTFDTTGALIEIGRRDSDLATAPMRLHRGEHALVLGGARSGRTNTLVAIARAAGADAVVVGDGELSERTGNVSLSPSALEAALQGRGATLVLVDDCTELDDSTGELAALVAAPPPGVHLIASARPDRYRAAYGHWSAGIRESRVGVLLRPEPLDGDLLGQQLPTRLGLPPVPGRGLVIGDGGFEIVQVVLADDHPSAG